MAARIDVHHHYVPDFYRVALVAAGHSHPDGMHAIPDWNEAQALRMMDRLGIEKAYLSISSPGVHFGDAAATRDLASRVNNEGARLKRAYPDRFGLFASTPLPDIEGALAEIERAYDELDADGVVFETNFAGEYLGDQALAPVFDALDRRSAVLFLHPTSSPCGCSTTPDGEAVQGVDLGYPRPMLEFIFDTTRTVTQMLLSGTLARHPRLRLVVPHAGAALPILADRIAMFLPMLKMDSIAPRDIREALRKLHYDLAGAPVPTLLQALLDVADPLKLHYGSDWPFTPVETVADLASKLDETPLLGGELRQAVMRGNAAALFDRTTDSRAADRL